VRLAGILFCWLLGVNPPECAIYSRVPGAYGFHVDGSARETWKTWASSLAFSRRSLRKP